MRRGREGATGVVVSLATAVRPGSKRPHGGVASLDMSGGADVWPLSGRARDLVARGLATTRACGQPRGGATLLVGEEAGMHGLAAAAAPRDVAIWDGGDATW